MGESFPLVYALFVCVHTVTTHMHLLGGSCVPGVYGGMALALNASDVGGMQNTLLLSAVIHAKTCSTMGLSVLGCLTSRAVARKLMYRGQCGVQVGTVVAVG